MDNSDDERKGQILEAALFCFLTFGYTKTSMDDVAKKAGFSRPLIYLKFKNKKEILEGVHAYLIEGCSGKAHQVLDENITEKKKLARVCEIMLLEPYDKIVGRPMSAEFYDTCTLHFPKAMEKHAQDCIEFYRRILNDKVLGEVFFFATEGLHSDLPSTKVLRKRLDVLIERFTGYSVCGPGANLRG